MNHVSEEAALLPINSSKLANAAFQHVNEGAMVRKGVATYKAHPPSSAIARQGNLWGKSPQPCRKTDAARVNLSW